MTSLRISFPTVAAAIMATGFSFQAVAQDANLSEVVVSASGFEQAVEDAPASITVIPRAELEKKAYQDVTDALKDVPGVVITGGGSSSDISIRGMGSAYTLFLVDGKRLSTRETRPNSDNAGIEQGWMPPLSAIERIEVVRGPMSSLYGSEAMGGVINIITRKVQKEWSGSISGETIQQESSLAGDVYQADFFLSGPIKQDTVGLQISGRKFRRNEDKYVDGFNEQDALSGTAKLSITPNKDHEINLEVARVMQERTSNPGKSMEVRTWSTRTNPPGWVYNDPSYANYDKSTYSLSHVGRFGIGTLNSYIQKDSIDNTNRKMYLDNTDFSTQLVMPLFGGKHMTTVGFAFKSEELVDKNNQYQPAKELDTLKRKQSAIFVEDEWSFSESLTFTGGLRATDDEKYGLNWNPRLYAVWKANDEVTVKGGISTGFKAPNLRHTVADWGQSSGGRGSSLMLLGNPNLKAEESVSQEVGLVWDNRRDTNASLTVYNTQFKNKIAESPICTTRSQCRGMGYDFDGVRDRQNVDEAVMQGLEATLTYKVNKNIRLSSNYTFQRTEQKSGAYKGQPLNKMPRHMLNTTVDWTVNSDLSTWTRVNFRGKTSASMGRTAMENGTPSFAFVDVGLNYSVNKGTKIGLGVYNVFDKKIDPETFDNPLDGRRYWIKMTQNF